jgi:hypothetical protein
MTGNSFERKMASGLILDSFKTKGKPYILCKLKKEIQDQVLIAYKNYAQAIAEDTSIMP